MSGRYATTREEFLEKHAPDFYETLKESGKLEEHLNNVQERATNYVERSVEHAKTISEYKKAEAEGDYVTTMRMINTASNIASMDAERMWVYTLPYDDEEDEEEEYEEDDDETDYDAEIRHHYDTYYGEHTEGYDWGDPTVSF